MGFHRAVAGFTTDGHFRHGGVIGVGGRIVVLAKPGVVAGGAGGIPVHALAGPRPPVAGVADFLAIDIEQIVFVRIVADVHRLQAVAGRGNEELAQRIVADDADDGIVPAFVAETQREYLCDTVRIEERL